MTAPKRNCEFQLGGANVALVILASATESVAPHHSELFRSPSRRHSRIGLRPRLAVTTTTASESEKECSSGSSVLSPIVVTSTVFSIPRRESNNLIDKRGEVLVGGRAAVRRVRLGVTVFSVEPKGDRENRFCAPPALPPQRHIRNAQHGAASSSVIAASPSAFRSSPGRIAGRPMNDSSASSRVSPCHHYRDGPARVANREAERFRFRYIIGKRSGPHCRAIDRCKIHCDGLSGRFAKETTKETVFVPLCPPRLSDAMLSVLVISNGRGRLCLLAEMSRIRIRRRSENVSSGSSDIADSVHRDLLLERIARIKCEQPISEPLKIGIRAIETAETSTVETLTVIAESARERRTVKRAWFVAPLFPSATRAD